MSERSSARRLAFIRSGCGREHEGVGDGDVVARLEGEDPAADGGADARGHRVVSERVLLDLHVGGPPGGADGEADDDLPLDGGVSLELLFVAGLDGLEPLADVLRELAAVHVGALDLRAFVLYSALD